MKKICFVVQRYGLEVNGGAELHCRQIAEKLAKHFEVEVLTTCAIDYYSWENHYKEGSELINGVKITRFLVDQRRDMELFGKKSSFVLNNEHSLKDEEEWMRLQGPFSSKLFEYLAKYKNNYDKFIFFTYLYATTFYGLPQVHEKSVLVPTSHDEPPIYLKIYKKLFLMPNEIFYSTLEEKKFIENKFNNSHIKNKIVGVGFDEPICQPGKFIKKHGADNFVIYVGRIDESKGCNLLFEYFLKLKKETKNNLKLVLVGKNEMKIPEDKDVIHLGFLSDQDKFDALSAAKLLINPSVYESLSMSVLESMICGIPVLVNENCEVTKKHCERSNAGLWFNDYESFKKTVELIENNPDIRAKMGMAGKNYVIKNYSWDRVINDYYF